MDKKTAKKIEIIQKSIHVMFEQGYNGTGVKDLADAAGIPKGSLYNYFSSKEEYAIEALNYYYNEMSSVQFNILADKNLKPLERIKGFYSSMIKDFEDEATCKLGCFVGNITQEMGGTNKALNELTGEIHKEIVQKIKNNLIEAESNGDLSAGKDLDSLADFIVSSWQGTLLRLKVCEGNVVLDEFYKILVEVLLK